MKIVEVADELAVNRHGEGAVVDDRPRMVLVDRPGRHLVVVLLTVSDYLSSAETRISPIDSAERIPFP